MKSCNRKILDLFYNAKHAGRIMKPEAIGRVGDQDDGLVIELSWRVVNDTIIDAKFRAFGNPNAIAITSLMTDYFIGKTIEEVMSIDESVISDALDELKPEYLDVYSFVCEAMEDAYQYYLKHKDKRNSEFNASVTSRDEEYAVLNNVEVEQELTQEDVERNIQQTIQREVMAEYKSSRGRPRTEGVRGDESIQGEKRGRGRPRKERTPEELEAMALAASQKRGRGRPRKERTAEELAELQNKPVRGRGRPRKERTPEELEAMALAASEKRGRGRPRKERTAEELAELQNKPVRGRGRPRKERTPEELEAMALAASEKRGRGRPRKNAPVKINFPKSDLDEVIADEVVEQLISGTPAERKGFVRDESKMESPIEYTLTEDHFNYGSGSTASNDYFNIEQSENKSYSILTADVDDETGEVVGEKRGRGRPRKERIQIEVIGEKRGRGRPPKAKPEGDDIEVGEKRGRGRPRKEVTEEIAEEGVEKRGRGRPRKDASTPIMPVNSLTRSLVSNVTPTYHSSQDIVFASKNVTTTNININSTKITTGEGENEKIISNEYSKNINITSTNESATLSNPNRLNASDLHGNELDGELEIESVKAKDVAKNNSLQNKFAQTEFESDEELDDLYDTKFADVDDFDSDEEIDASHIKDEAPKGGIEDLLKALLDD